MKISEVVTDSLESAKRIIMTRTTKSFDDLNRYGHPSTFTVTVTFEELSSTINHELKELFINLKLIKLGMHDLRNIRSILYSFIDNSFAEWKKELISQRILSAGGDSDAYKHDLFIRKRVTEAKTIVNLEFLITKERILSRRRQFLWDLSKIGVTAIVGGIIGAYIKVFLP